MARISEADPRKSFPDKSLIAMIGLLPLPGSPRYGGSEQAVVDRALLDAEVYARAGVDALLIENSADLPYIKPPLPEVAVRVVERVAHLLRMKYSLPIGLQLLEAANEQALRVAAACSLDFIRVEGYVFAHVGGAGLIEGCAGRLQRLRRDLGAQQIQLFGDVRKKHCSHALTGDLDLQEHIRQAEFFLADGVVITGPRTGAEPEEQDLLDAGKVTVLPRLIGSGMTPENLHRYFDHAEGFIIGSTFRQEGRFLGNLDPDRLEVFMDEFRRLKSAGGGE